jgi:hypothetical protein
VTARDEKGSLVIALAVILVLSGLSLAVLARTVSALGSARLAQDSAAAVSAADTGVTDALYVLGHTAPLQLSGSGPSFVWHAELGSPPTAGTVTSTGTVNGHAHTVVVDISREPQWPWVFATSGSMVLDGPISVDPTASLAAGGQLVVRNNATDGASQALLGAGASCSGCTNPVTAATDTLPEPSLPSPAPSAPPGGCSGIATLPTGTWVCQDVASFAGPSVSVGPGQVDLYVVPTGPAPATVDFGSAAIAPAGGAASFVVHVVGAGVVHLDGSTVTGVIDAPHSSLRSASCGFTLTGAADLGSADCVAGAGVTLTYDSSLAGALSQVWRVSSYRDAGP